MARSLGPLIVEMRHPSAPSSDPFLLLHREMNRLFDDALRGPGAASGATLSPRMNVSETEHDLRIEMELPGVPEQDVQVELAGDMLTIRGEKRAEREDAQYHIAERSFGSFARSLRVPFAVQPESVQASFHGGLLTVLLPKPSVQDRVHRIPVQPAESPGRETQASAAATAGHPTPDTTAVSGTPANGTEGNT